MNFFNFLVTNTYFFSNNYTERLHIYARKALSYAFIFCIISTFWIFSNLDYFRPRILLENVTNYGFQIYGSSYTEIVKNETIHHFKYETPANETKTILRENFDAMVRCTKNNKPSDFFNDPRFNLTENYMCQTSGSGYLATLFIRFGHSKISVFVAVFLIFYLLFYLGKPLIWHILNSCLNIEIQKDQETPRKNKTSKKRSEKKDRSTLIQFEDLVRMQEIVDIVNMHEATAPNRSLDIDPSVRKLYEDRVKRLKRNWRRKMKKAMRKDEKVATSNTYLLHKFQESLKQTQKDRFASAIADLKNLDNISMNTIKHRTTVSLENQKNEDKKKKIKIEEFDTLASYDFKVRN